ncbi:MAG: PQQ-dependent sugar dehydrogenase, partial [Gammaproteobacteria bacterium]
MARIASATLWPCETRTSTCRSLATTSSGLCRFVPICPSSSGSKAIPQGGPLQWGRIKFGPTGGDEINIIEPGRNYGWPLVSWGQHMDGSAIPRPPARPDLDDAAYHWSLSISFSGIAFYSSRSFPSWRGNLFLAGLTSQAVIRLTLVASRVTGEERIPMGERIRQVVQGPDGLLYL